ncbi:MAG TPA: hypothetical protein VJA21_10325 [Verrucomicrobiae bacterium]
MRPRLSFHCCLVALIPALFWPPRLNGQSAPPLPASTPRFLRCVAFGNGTFVAVGFNRNVLVSRDGTNWVNRSEAVAPKTFGINYSAIQYVAGGDSLTLVAPRGDVSGTERPKHPYTFRAVGFGNHTFVILGEQGETLVSPDGERWQPVAVPTRTNLNAISWGAGQFVAVGEGGVILTSPNAQSWLARSSGTDASLNAIAYGNGMFLAVGDESTVLTSVDGIRWKRQAIPYGAPLGAVGFGNHQFMISAAYGYSLTMVSSDGKAWREVAHPCGGLLALAYGNGMFVAVGANNAWPRGSPDGTSWQPPLRERCRPTDWAGAAFGNGVFVAVGRALAVSRDGIHWAETQMPASRLLHAELRSSGVGRISPMIHYPEGTFLLPLLRMGAHEWHTIDQTPIAGNVTGEETYLFLHADKLTVLTSADGMYWTELSPTLAPPPAAPPPVAVAAEITTATNTDSVISSVELPVQLNGRSFNCGLVASPGQIFELQASVDLHHWMNLTRLTNSGGSLILVDPEATNFPYRFYRLMPVP